MDVMRNGVRFHLTVNRDGNIYVSPPIVGANPPVLIHLGKVDVRLPENKVKKLAVKLMREQGIGSVTQEV